MAGNNQMNRKERCMLAREQVFSVLFEKIFSNDSIDDIIDNAIESRMLVMEKYATELLETYSANSDRIDKFITDNVKGWTVSRISKVSLSVLRLAITELEYYDTPVSVAINEAVELTKKYATDKDGAFVNGVLGSIVRKKESEKSIDKDNENEKD